MDWLTIISMSVGLMSLVLGGFAIWLSLHLYMKSKDAEKSVATALEAIRAQSETLQKLTGRWMDRFTRHATEPRPSDEGLLQLVNVVASLPQTILLHLRTPGLPQPTAQTDTEPLLRELVDCYILIYYHAAVANFTAQTLLPQEDSFNGEDEVHRTIQTLVDRSATTFTHISGVIQKIDDKRLRASALREMLDDAFTQWAPYVRSTAQVYESRRETTG